MGRAARSHTSLQRAAAAPPPPTLPAAGTATVQLTQVQTHTLTYHSPMPPARELRLLERLHSGVTERFLQLTEQEAAHRRALQSRALWFNGLNATLGVLFGGAIGLLGVGGGIVGMVTGRITDLAGAGVVISALASLVGVYMAGRRRGGSRPG